MACVYSSGNVTEIQVEKEWTEKATEQGDMGKKRSSIYECTHISLSFTTTCITPIPVRLGR